MDNKPTKQDRTVTVLTGVAIAIIVALITTAVVMAAAAFYGPAWVAIAEEHGRTIASLQVAWITGAGLGVWQGLSFYQHHKNCTVDGCQKAPDDAED